MTDHQRTAASVAVRDGCAGLRAFHNACRHRGVCALEALNLNPPERLTVDIRI